jgi:hypothetical protein
MSTRTIDAIAGATGALQEWFHSPSATVATIDQVVEQLVDEAVEASGDGTLAGTVRATLGAMVQGWKRDIVSRRRD